MSSNPASSSPYYLEKYGFGEHPHITTCFTKCGFRPGQVFQFLGSHVYDHSKFWIIVKWKEQDLFQKYLFRFYYVHHTKYQVPENKIEQYMYCVIPSNGVYYRGVITGIPIDFHEERVYTVYLFDFGNSITVTPSDILYLTKQFAEVPQFAVRASLAEVCPKKSLEWPCLDVTNFCKLVQNKVLIGTVVNVLKSTQVLEIRISENNASEPLHKQLVKEGCARYFDEKLDINKCVPIQKNSLKPKLEYPHLFPSHEAIESAKIPTNRYDAVFQVATASSAKVLARYYTTQDDDNER